MNRLVLEASAAIRLVMRASDSRALAAEMEAATLVLVPSIDEVFEDRELMTESLHQVVAHRYPVYDLLCAVFARRTGAAVLTVTAGSGLPSPSSTTTGSSPVAT